MGAREGAVCARVCLIPEPTSCSKVVSGASGGVMAEGAIRKVSKGAFLQKMGQRD